MFKLTSLVLALGFGVLGCSTQFDSSDHPTTVTDDGGCTYTQGYWKNHPEAWPVSSVKLGDVSYTKEQALAIFNKPVQGNGLVALAHQLLAAKLNLASGASGAAIAASIAAADALIGVKVVPPIGNGSLAPGATSSLVSSLNDYNTGTTGPGHCDGDPPPPPEPFCGDGTVNQQSEQCDDGNNTGGDGCDASCHNEPPPPPPPSCGDGKVNQESEQCDDGNHTGGDGCDAYCHNEPPPPQPYCGDGTVNQQSEQCDDGNATNGDGCSSRCETEAPPPPPSCCGNGAVEAGEQCDDGNSSDGDGCSSRCEIETTTPPPCGD